MHITSPFHPSDQERLKRITERAVHSGILTAQQAEEQSPEGPPGFKEYVVSMGFKLEELTPQQRDSMLQIWKAKQAQHQAAGAEGGQWPNDGDVRRRGEESTLDAFEERAAFEDYVRSFGFDPVDLTPEQRESMQRMYDESDDNGTS